LVAKERFEDPVERRGRDAAAGVADRQVHPSPASWLDRRQTRVVFHLFHNDRDLPAVWYGVRRIQNEIA
jgi:hypothetical protein